MVCLHFLAISFHILLACFTRTYHYVRPFYALYGAGEFVPDALHPAGGRYVPPQTSVSTINPVGDALMNESLQRLESLAAEYHDEQL